jgi:hypothetical protein
VVNVQIQNLIENYHLMIRMTNNDEQFINTYQKYGVLELRPYCGEKRIFVGCGMIMYDRWNYSDWFNSYRNKHLHENDLTIDPNIMMNPSIVRSFGKDQMDFLPKFTKRSI